MEYYETECHVSQTLASEYAKRHQQALHNWYNGFRSIGSIVHNSSMSAWWAQRARFFLFSMIGDGKTEAELENFG